MKTMMAILVSLTVPFTVLAQRDEGGTSAGTVALIAVEGPLHRSVAREAKRLARMPETGSSQTQQTAHHHGHPVLLGAAIGAGAGFLLNATACRTGESVCTGPGNLLMAAIGAGIGAAIGALVSR
jgi:hypothetical protein